MPRKCPFVSTQSFIVHAQCQTFSRECHILVTQLFISHKFQLSFFQSTQQCPERAMLGVLLCPHIVIFTWCIIMAIQNHILRMQYQELPIKYHTSPTQSHTLLKYSQYTRSAVLRYIYGVPLKEQIVDQMLQQMTLLDFSFTYKGTEA